MIDSIKFIQSYKGVALPFEIHELKNINIICGKNNSGKTSILESINRNNKHDKTITHGYSLKNIRIQDSFRRQFREMAQKMRPGIIHGSKFNSNLTNLIEFITDNFEYIYLEFKSVIAEVMFKHFQEFFNRTARTISDFEEMMRQFLINIKYEDFRQTLIPVERRIRVSDSFGFDQIGASGSNLVSYLFNMKNKDPNHPFRKLYDEIQNKFTNITEIEFDINSDNKINSRNSNNHGDLIIKFKVQNNYFDGDTCGYGLMQTLLILTYTIATNFNFIMIEEPENNLHPEMQKKLLNFLKSVEEKQFLISTHSNTMIDMNYVDQIYYVWYDGKIHIEEKTNRYELLSSIGYSIIDNLTSNIIVIVEGPNDKDVIEHILSWYDIDKKIKIGFGTLNGKCMEHIDLSVYKENREVFVLFDLDPGNIKQQKILIENCEKYGIKWHRLERYSIEHYFTYEAMNSVNGTNFSNLNQLKRIPKESGYCKKKNKDVIKLMEAKDIEDTDLYNGFIKHIIEYVKVNYP